MSTCRHCGCVIEQNGREAGLGKQTWGTTMEHDPNDGHPWYCIADPTVSKRHEPAR